MFQTTLGQITYNPAQRAFEACVTLKDTDGSYTYPCALRCAMETDFDVIARQLTQLARRKHARFVSQETPAMRGCHGADKEDDDLTARAMSAETSQAIASLWHRVQNHAR
jgi:hypothetical protein